MSLSLPEPVTIVSLPALPSIGVVTAIAEIMSSPAGAVDRVGAAVPTIRFSEAPSSIGVVTPPTSSVTSSPVTPVTVTPPFAVVFTVPDDPSGNVTTAAPEVIVTGPPDTSFTSML